MILNYPFFQSPKVSFEVGSGSDPFPVDDETADLITSVTAVHWMDLPKFYDNALKALRPGT